MSKWILVRIESNGEKVALPKEYDSYDDACAMQEFLDDANPYNAHLIYTNDEWMYEVENGNVLPS